MDEGKVNYYLEMWQSYMKQDNNKLGYKTKSSGFNTGGIHSFEDMAEEQDYKDAKIVDTCIDDVTRENPMCGAAINARWLGTKSMLNPMAVDMYYGLAISKLEKRLHDKGLH